MIRIEEGTVYEIQAGQSNFSPAEPFWPPFRASGFELAGRFSPDCWWSLEDWGGDKDWYDWNKLKGLTYAFSANNRCAAMIAWRPGKLENTFEITAYTNDKRGGWTVTGKPVTVYAGEVFYCTARLYDDAVQYEIEYFGNVTKYLHKWRKPWLRYFREVGTWIGGNNSEPGPYGGKASQDMEMEIAFKTYR